jgi:signal transduction histidine kinase
MTVQTKLASAYGLAVVILCAMCLISYRNAAKIEETRQCGRHSSAVLQRGEALAESLARVEAISFEYAGTRDPQALSSLDFASAGALSAEGDLHSLTADNLSQQRRLAILEPKLARYLVLLRDAIAAPANTPTGASPREPAAARPFLPERAQLSHDISDLIQQMNAEEDRLSLVRRQAIDEGLHRSSDYLAFGYASAILLSVLCIVLQRGEMRHRTAIQHELENAQAGLELRVHERTEDLRAANLALQAQVEERKRAERQVQQLNSSLEMRVEQRTLELTQAVKELDSFCYTVSHDLRAPLRHVDGFSRILESEYGGELSDEARHYLHRIVQAVNQMGRLIDDLLDLSRIGRKKLTRRRVSVQDLVERAISSYRDIPDGHGVDWRVDPLPELSCDPGLLEIVYANLIANAVKFTRSLPHRMIQFGALSSSDSVTLFVRDNGVGFDPQYADKLFGVFQRLHSLEDFEGTGIGLATVQRIVHRHGGSIRAESQPGCGATFYFTLGAQSMAATTRKLEEVKHVRV